MNRSTRSAKPPGEENLEEITLAQIYAKLNILDDMKTDITGLKTDITGLKTDIATLVGVQKDLTELTDKVNAHIFDCDGLKDEVKRVDQETQSLKTQNVDLKKRVDELMYQLQQQRLADKAEASFRTRNREKSLIIEGLVERDGEDPVRLAASILSKTGRRVHPLDIDEAYREGPKHNRRPRPLVVVLVRRVTRMFVMINRRRIKDHEDCTRIWINEDISPEKRRQWAELRLLVEQAGREGLNARQIGDTIVVEGMRYKHQDIHRLPAPLSLENASIKKTPKGYAFFSKHCCLSNFAPAMFNFEGRDYSCLEQAYHYIRACKAGKHEIANRILLENDPIEIKKLGGSITDTLDWKKERRDIMKSLLLAKFDQNPSMLDKLLATGNEPLIEATWDKIWASAAPFFSKEIATGTWSGKNLLGVLLVEIRIILRRKRDGGDDDSSNGSSETEGAVGGVGSDNE